MAPILLSQLSKRYQDGMEAVTGLDLEIGDGEFLVLVGPSGCGKTTALRMVAGLEEVSAGAIYIGDTLVNDVPSRDRDVAMVFQSYALYPHLNIFENISFGLRLRKMSKTEIDRRVHTVAAILDLEHHLDRKPKHLSGGQRQRVAMGRAIVREPRAFLMDEPLSNLDAKLRVQMRAEIARIQRDLNVTTVYVTHDQTEAMTLGDRVAVMQRGVLQQVGPPQDLYDHPTNLFVASFIGSPGMNLMSVPLRRGDGWYSVEIGTQHLALPAAVVARHACLADYVDRNVVLGIRPEDMEDAAIAGVQDGEMLTGVADLVEAMGSDVLVHLPVPVAPVDSEYARGIAGDLGQTAAAVAPEGVVLVGRFSPRTRVFEGQKVEVRVDTSRMHFFDPATGESLHNN